MYTNVRPSSPPLCTYPQLKAQLKIDADDEMQYLMDLLDAATEYAESALDASLLTRTITATIEEHYPAPTFSFWPGDHSHRHFLPRGPVQSITSVTDSTGNAIQYKWERTGNSDFVIFTGQPPGIVWPVTVVYQSGYGNTAAAVPADIRLALRAHVASLWSNREATTTGTNGQMADAPLSLQAFYSLKRRTTPVS